MSQTSSLSDTRHGSPKVATKLAFDSDEDSYTLSLQYYKEPDSTLRTRLFVEDEDSRDSGVGLGNDIEDSTLTFDLPERSFSILANENKFVTNEETLTTLSTYSPRVENRQKISQRLRQKRERNDECSPLRQKRRRKTFRHTGLISSAILISAHHPSMSDVTREYEYKQDVERNDSGSDDEALTGDKVDKLCLPTVAGKHRDLNCVTPDTLACVLSGEFSEVVDEVVIVDCRYPYEYEGGHIMGAMNIYTKEQLLERFMENVNDAHFQEKRTILIFHCEFSSERAPKMCRFLRQTDRQANSEHYPKLNYPELYLLDGGYKNFFESKKELCIPPSYLPMNHKEHKDDLRKFRMKSKSWAGDKKSRSVFGF